VNYRQLKHAASEATHEPLFYVSTPRPAPGPRQGTTWHLAGGSLNGCDFTSDPMPDNRPSQVQRAARCHGPAAISARKAQPNASET